MNNEIAQSIFSTYTALRTYLQVLNSRTVVWLFAILHESLNVWLYYVTYVWCLMARAIPRQTGVYHRHPCMHCSLTRPANSLHHPEPEMASFSQANGRCTSLLRGRAPVSEMTYTVSSVMLNSSIPYHQRHTQTRPWARVLFSPTKTARDPRQRIR